MIREDRINMKGVPSWPLGTSLASGGNSQWKRRMNYVATQRVEGLRGGLVEPPGFVFSVAGGAVSGSIAILGSTLGGVIAERGSGIVWGRRSIPGSIREGGGTLGA